MSAVSCVLTQYRSALDLASLGLSVIPIHHPGAPLPERLTAKAAGKAPLVRWDRYQVTRPTDAELRSWFDVEEPRNVGVVCGRVSGVVVIDCDDPDALDVALDCLPVTPVRTLTAKGAHLFFRYPTDAAAGEAFGNKSGVLLGGLKYRIDLRADAGYVVVPPSIHATGVEYEAPEPWLTAFERMPMLPATELRALYRASSGSTPPTVSRRPVLTSTRADGALAQAQRYFARVPPAVEGCGGDHFTFVQACRAIRDFGLSQGEAFDVLRDWNARCVPPWSDRELLAKLQGAQRYGHGAFGCKVTTAVRSMTQTSGGTR